MLAHDSRGHPEILPKANCRWSPRTRTASRSSRRSRRSKTLVATRPTCCPRRARWIRPVSPRRQDKSAVREIKEWQAIMDHLRALPVKTPGELPIIPVDERAAKSGRSKWVDDHSAEVSKRSGTRTSELFILQAKTTALAAAQWPSGRERRNSWRQARTRIRNSEHQSKHGDRGPASGIRRDVGP